MWFEGLVELGDVVDISEVLGDPEDVLRGKSPMQFLRDRELGIRGAGECDPHGRVNVRQHQKSSVRFLRDRELGIRGTSERAIRQGVEIAREPICDWPYSVRWKIYTQLRNLCDKNWHYCYEGFPSKENRNHWARLMADRLPLSALYIAIPAGCGKWVQLLVMDYVNKSNKHFDNPDITTVRQVRLCRSRCALCYQ